MSILFQSKLLWKFCCDSKRRGLAVNLREGSVWNCRFPSPIFMSPSFFLNLFIIAFFVYVYMACRGRVHGGAFMSWYMHKSKDNFWDVGLPFMWATHIKLNKLPWQMLSPTEPLSSTFLDPQRQWYILSICLLRSKWKSLWGCYHDNMPLETENMIWCLKEVESYFSLPLINPEACNCCCIMSPGFSLFLLNLL